MSAETELTGRRAHGPWSDLALHTIGWRPFQDLCSQVCEVVLDRPVEIFREANDGGQDALFLIPSEARASPIGTVRCKHTSDAGKALKVSNLTAELENVEELVKAGQADTYIFMTNMSVDAPVAVAARAKLRALGLRKAHIFGRQHIVRVIRSSARLRALVPQVYGLPQLPCRITISPLSARDGTQGSVIAVRLLNGGFASLLRQPCRAAVRLPPVHLHGAGRDIAASRADVRFSGVDAAAGPQCHPSVLRPRMGQNDSRHHVIVMPVGSSEVSVCLKRPALLRERTTHRKGVQCS